MQQFNLVEHLKVFEKQTFGCGHLNMYHKLHIVQVYVDTVGDVSAYQRKLEESFPSVKITVAKKADSLYPIVSAASICAKVSVITTFLIYFHGCNFNYRCKNRRKLIHSDNTNHNIALCLVSLPREQLCQRCISCRNFVRPSVHLSHVLYDKPNNAPGIF